MPLSYVELFAGCGGMSLGLDSSGMTRLMSNELSPMAAETYAFNLLGVDLQSGDFRAQPLHRRNVLWLQSRYKSAQVLDRLDENPQEFAAQGVTGELSLAGDLRGKLVVADVRELNKYVEQNGPLLGDVKPDVVSGGPPCQSFSMAGLREYGNRRNRLPWEFANFAEAHEPRLVVLENVSGILRPFEEEGRKVYVWFEVAKAFAAKGYAPICLHVNAARVGVAQNRPRFLMFAVRADEVAGARRNLGEHAWALDMGVEMLAAKGDLPFDPARHRAIDLTKEQKDLVLDEGPLGSHFRTIPVSYSVGRAIGDLAAGGTNDKTYSRELSALFAEHLVPARRPSTAAANNDHRMHTPTVRARFRAYQIVEALTASGDAASAKLLFDMIKGKQDPRQAGTAVLEAALTVPDLPMLNEAGRAVTEPAVARSVLAALKTRKHTQRALGENRPAPAAVSIPDDACHYRELRTLSVREMARIQSFPDEFVFRSQVTTGGVRRRFQVPQYTQVGNAVPPKLARQIGSFCQLLLCGS